MTEEELKERTANIAASCRMDSRYSPLEDIKSIIKNLPKPDVLVINNEGEVFIYSNQPEKLGTVLFYNEEEDPKGAAFTTLGKLESDAKEWKKNIIKLELEEFLKKFILNNL